MCNKVSLHIGAALTGDFPDFSFKRRAIVLVYFPSIQKLLGILNICVSMPIAYAIASITSLSTGLKPLVYVGSVS